MGVVFFPSLPFMGVMLFPSFRLGNASREWGLVRPSPPTPHSLFFFFFVFPFFFFFFQRTRHFISLCIRHFLFQGISHFTSLLCPHLLLLLAFSSLCLSPLSPFLFFFFFFKSTAFSSRAPAIFSSRAPVIFSYRAPVIFSSRAPAVFFFLRGSPVLSLLKELLVMYV